MVEYIPPQQLVSARVRLDTNESPYSVPIPPIQVENLNKYPFASEAALKKAIAEHHGVSPDQVCVGCGSSQLLDAAITTFGAQGVVVSSPTYAQYHVLAARRDCSYISVPSDNGDFHLNACSFIEEMRSGAMGLLCNPNNPDGHLESADVISNIASESCSRTLVVDEAYIDFANNGRESAVECIDSDPNIVVIRTFSKAYGAAGLRLGYSISGEERSAAMRGALALCPTNEYQHLVGMYLLRQQEQMQLLVQQVVNAREEMARELESIGCTVLPSATSFLLFQPPTPHTASVLHEQLLSKSIALRQLDDPSVHNYLRVCVGTPQDNEAFLYALREIIRS